MNKNMIWWFLIVILVIGILVFITINKNDNSITTDGIETDVGTEQQDMPNTQQIEGVKITIIKEGNGDIAKFDDMIAMNYTGKLTDGTVFDSNIDPKFGHVDPFIFNLGAGEVIKGWDTGIIGMKVGEKRMLEINPDYAYGPSGRGSIPPNSTLIFEVELLGIKK